MLDGEYIWKYTHNAYDFNVFGTSPITLPIEWADPRFQDLPFAAAFRIITG